MRLPYPSDEYRCGGDESRAPLAKTPYPSPISCAWQLGRQTTPRRLRPAPHSRYSRFVPCTRPSLWPQSRFVERASVATRHSLLTLSTVPARCRCSPTSLCSIASPHRTSEWSLPRRQRSRYGREIRRKRRKRPRYYHARHIVPAHRHNPPPQTRRSPAHQRRTCYPPSRLRSV